MTAVPDHDGPGDLPRPQRVPLLIGQRRVLVEALTRKSGKSGRAIGMYLEALGAMARNDVPEHLHVAAYELREFMNALPRALDLPAVKYEQVNGKIQAFVLDWTQRSTKTRCFKNGKWEGPIDNDLRGLLESTMGLVSWIETHVPSRRVEAEAVLQKLAPTEEPIPSALMKLRTDEWSELLGYFNKYTHHDSDPDSVEFNRRVVRLEGFLLEHLEPRTFEDQDDIDRLVREVEGR